MSSCDAETLAKEIIKIAGNINYWNSMKKTALQESGKYLPEIAIRPLLEKFF